MRNEFNELHDEVENHHHVVGISIPRPSLMRRLENLNKKIEEVENRLMCVDRIAIDIVETISKFTEQVDGERSKTMSREIREEIQRGAVDIQIAIDLNDSEPIESNWYELFQPSETDVILKGIEQIESDEELTKKFRTRYDTEFPMIKACVKSDMLKKEAIKFIKELTKI